jgi:hypothetical protein
MSGLDAPLSSSQTTYAPPFPSPTTRAALAMLETTMPVSGTLPNGSEPSSSTCRYRSATTCAVESWALTPNQHRAMPPRPSGEADRLFTSVPRSEVRAFALKPW